MLFLCSIAIGGGSGVCMSPRQQAEKRNERASKKRANGALINCTSGPATAGPPISASDRAYNGAIPSTEFKRIRCQASYNDQ